VTTYEITITIDSTSRPDAIQQTAERMTRDWFGSTGEVTNLLEIDDELDTDLRCCTCQATDDHNETVTRALGWRRYIRTDRTVWTNPDLEED
jgi:hypothetical protein